MIRLFEEFETGFNLDPTNKLTVIAAIALNNGKLREFTS